MAMTNAERQNRYRKKVKVTGRQRVEAIVPFEVAIKLDYLADHWGCNQGRGVKPSLNGRLGAGRAADPGL